MKENEHVSTTTTVARDLRLIPPLPEADEAPGELLGALPPVAGASLLAACGAGAAGAAAAGAGGAPAPAEAGIPYRVHISPIFFRQVYIGSLTLNR